MLYTPVGTLQSGRTRVHRRTHDPAAPSRPAVSPQQRYGAMATVKKRVATFALVASLTTFGISFGLAFPSQALAWDNCPKGLVNDPYPGACSRYVDTDGDDICDLSQSEPVESTTTTTTAPKSETTTTTLAVTTTTSGEPPTGDCPLGPCAGCGACLSIGSLVSVETAAGAVALAAASGSATTSTTTPSSGGPSDSSATATGASGDSVATVSATGAEDSGGASLFTGYNVSPIAIGFFLIYAASFVLHKTKRIKVTTHRKIWNVLLLATFLITGIFGLILTIQLDYDLPFTIPFDLLFWHVEAGVAMTLISIFHVSWHFNYYRNLLRRSRKKVRAARAAEQAQPLGGQQLVWEARAQRRAERDTKRHPVPRPDPAPRPAQTARPARTPRPYTPPTGRLEPETD